MLLFRALLFLFSASWCNEDGNEMRAIFAARRRGAAGLLGGSGCGSKLFPMFC